MNESQWIVAKASVAGVRHMQEKTACQDTSDYQFFEKEAFGIAVVADGAGYAENSAKGSSLVVQYSKDLFSELVCKEQWNQDMPAVENWQKKAEEVFRIVYNRLTEYGIEQNIEIHTLATTVIVMIITAKGLLVTHIGDGRACYRDDCGNWITCFDPYKGEYANETVFITSDFWKEKEPAHFIGSYVIIGQVTAFSVLSDGMEMVSFRLNEFNSNKEIHESLNEPYKAFFEHNVTVLTTYKRLGLLPDEINGLWAGFLSTGNPALTIEPDDKSMILGVKMENTDVNVNES